MSKQVLILSGLLGAAMVGSYLTWTNEDGTDADDTIVALPGAPEDIASVTYTAEKLTVELIGQEDDRGRFLWVTTTEKKRKPKPPKSHDDDHGDEHDEVPPLDEPPLEPGVDAPDAPDAPEEPVEPVEAVPEEPEYEDVITSFMAGSSGDDLLADLAPFIAKRALGVVGEERYEDYGLVEPKATLVVARDGKEARTFELGGEAYGTRDVYMLDTSNGQVYLVDKDLSRPLKSAASRMPERELLGLEMGDVLAVRIETANDSRELEHRNRADPKAAFFAPKGVEEKDDVVEAWLDKALALKSAGYVQAGSEPSGLETAFTVSLATGEGSTTLIVSTGTDSDGEVAWYASSDHTRGKLVELHAPQATEAAADLDAVFDDVELPADEE